MFQKVCSPIHAQACPQNATAELMSEVYKKKISSNMATKMIIPSPDGKTLWVDVTKAQEYYVTYKHHLTHNDNMTPEQRKYCRLYVKYFEKIAETDYVPRSDPRQGHKTMGKK